MTFVDKRVPGALTQHTARKYAHAHKCSSFELLQQIKSLFLNVLALLRGERQLITRSPRFPMFPIGAEFRE